MNGYSLTSDQRLKIVSLLIEHALSTHPSMEEILSSGFRGFMNLSDRELVESAQECSLDIPQGIDLPGNDGANRTYRVTWVIDIEEATGPHEAAERARAHQHPATTAVVFECLDVATGKTTEVDLLDGRDLGLITRVVYASSDQESASVHLMH